MNTNSFFHQIFLQPFFCYIKHFRLTKNFIQHYAERLYLNAKALFCDSIGIKHSEIYWNTLFIVNLMGKKKLIHFEVQQSRDLDYLLPIFVKLNNVQGIKCYIHINERENFFSGTHFSVARLRQLIIDRGISDRQIVQNLYRRISFGNMILSSNQWDNIFPFKFSAYLEGFFFISDASSRIL